jgi:hypothetical protein
VFAFIERINNYFLLTCVFNISWILAWHYLQIELSVVIMLLFLITLIQLFLKSTKIASVLTTTQKFILQTPFIVYLGWISVATIANVTALLVAYKWTAWSIAPAYWSAAMIMIAIILAVFMLIKFKAVPFALVVAWALWGIYNAQGPAAPLLASITAGGIGVLITRLRNFQKPPLEPISFGGGQERGLRPGTLPVFLIAGLGKAAEIALRDYKKRNQYNKNLQEKFFNFLEQHKAKINGDLNNLIENTVNFSIKGIDSEAFILTTKDIISVSNGSACTSALYEPSHVIKSMTNN